jgi:formylglycine-generating enzyme required for sulfatase activity
MTLVRQAFVLLLAGLLATLAIFAGDELRVAKNSLLGALGKSDSKDNNVCPSDMAAVNTSQGVLCVDKYEESAGDKCAHLKPANSQETTENAGWPECKPISVKGATPWVNVALHQAVSLCARAGKRLPSAEEWYRAALGTPDPYGNGERLCNINAIGKTEGENTGSYAQCVSSAGTYDMVGNVWEWVDETVEDGMRLTHKLPDEGYVSAVDSAGVPTSVRPDPDPSFGGDYFWVNKTGSRGMFRGGFWGVGEKVGLYAVNATVETSFTGVGVGFRCVK